MSTWRPSAGLGRADICPLPRADNLLSGDECRAFMCVRNEMKRIGQVLRHHRKLGVTRFFVVDNDSDDGTREYLLAQDDCHVFIAKQSFAVSNHGTRWLNWLLDRFGNDAWCLIVDADEMFVYPGCETVALPQFARYLDTTGAKGLAAFLLDMYGEGSIADTPGSPDRPLIDSCPFFDRHYQWRRRLSMPFRRRPFPGWTIVGGPRMRRFYARPQGMSGISYELKARLGNRLHALGVPVPAALVAPPFLTKIPFVRWSPGMRFMDKHHTVPIPLSPVTGALLHFKFLSDFPERAATEARRGEHYMRSAEYVRYAAAPKREPEMRLYYEGSVRYRDSAQLVDLGLLRDDHGWRGARARAAEPAAPAS
jgi:hypothetical protein